MEGVIPLLLVITGLVTFATVLYVLLAYLPRTPDPNQLEPGDLGIVLRLHTPMQWLSAVGLTIFFLITGIHIATGVSQFGVVDDVFAYFSQWGYDDGFRRFVARTQILAAILLIPPITTTWASLYLAVLMGGSVAVHVAMGSGQPVLVPLLALVGLVYLMVSRGR